MPASPTPPFPPGSLPPPLPPPPSRGPWSRGRPLPRQPITTPMRVVGIAQFFICGLLVLGAVFALLALALSVLIAGPFVAIIFEAVIGPLFLAAALIAVHFVIAVAVFEMRRWAIILFAVVSAAYVIACVAGIIEGRGGSADALRSRVVLSLALWAMLAPLNALALSQWRHAR